jgi:hypothetical protein
MKEHMPLSRREVVSVVGSLDDARIAAIIGTGATLDELVEAFTWTNEETDALAEARKQLAGRVAEVYDILTEDEFWEEER